MPRTNFPKYKEKYETTQQDLLTERRARLSAEREAHLMRLVGIGLAIFSLLCLAVAASVI